VTSTPKQLLHFEGGNALSAFRAQALLPRLQAVSPRITGVFARHPKLRIMDAELNFGWVPFWMNTLDEIYEKQKGWANFGIDETPSNAMGRNLFVTVLDDKLGFDLVAVEPRLADLALFSTDYPHSICLWPDTLKDIERAAVNCDPVSKQKILAGNAVRIFNLN